MAKIVEKKHGLYIEIPLETYNNQHSWNIRITENGNREPLKIIEEKMQLAEIIINALNKKGV
tara:strand:- start:1250 stop:1435 length:186 start_codon:yes stop_codon:yes gene_type:complete